MHTKGLRIAVHATLRFIERISPGIGFTDARKQIDRLVNSPRMMRAIRVLGGGQYKIVANGIIFCVRNGCVTTCYPCRT